MAKTTKTKSVAPRSRYAKSEKLFGEAVQVMPGGVSSPVRSFKAVAEAGAGAGAGGGDAAGLH